MRGTARWLRPSHRVRTDDTLCGSARGREGICRTEWNKSAAYDASPWHVACRGTGETLTEPENAAGVDAAHLLRPRHGPLRVSANAIAQGWLTMEKFAWGAPAHGARDAGPIHDPHQRCSANGATMRAAMRPAPPSMISLNTASSHYVLQAWCLDVMTSPWGLHRAHRPGLRPRKQGGAS